MAKGKTSGTRNADSAAAASKAAGRTKERPPGGPPSIPTPGNGGQGGSGAPKNPKKTNSDVTVNANSTPTPAVPAPFPEGSRIVQGMGGTSIVTDKEGTIITTIPSQTPLPQGPTPSVPLEGTEEFRAPASQVQAAKRLASRKVREVENAEFFSKGGTHELLYLIQNKARQEAAVQAKKIRQAQGASSAPDGRDNKRKRATNVTPTVTPSAKNPKVSTTPNPSGGGGYAEAAKRHLERQQESRKDRAQTRNPFLFLFVEGA